MQRRRHIVRRPRVRCLPVRPDTDKQTNYNDMLSQQITKVVPVALAPVCRSRSPLERSASPAACVICCPPCNSQLICEVKGHRIIALHIPATHDKVVDAWLLLLEAAVAILTAIAAIDGCAIFEIGCRSAGGGIHDCAAVGQLDAAVATGRAILNAALLLGAAAAVGCTQAKDLWRPAQGRVQQDSIKVVLGYYVPCDLPTCWGPRGVQ